MKRFLLLWFVATISITTPLFSQSDTDPPKSKVDSVPSAYDNIITDKAISSSGLWTVHQVEEKWYFDLPTSLLEKEILVVSRISGFVKNLNFGGAGVKSRPQQVIRWQKMGKKVLLRSVSFNSVATLDDPIYKSVKNNNFEPVIMVFDQKAKTDSSVVIEVTSLFTSDIPMIGAITQAQRKKFGVKGLDKGRSFISSMRAFPENVEVRHVLTYKGGTKLPDNKITATLSVEMNQSFILLPKKPMQPRAFDPRVGYFSVSQTNYSSENQWTDQQRFITRWRLEPKDPEAYAKGELVEPVKPIVFYLDPATPKKWRPYLKQGVNDWQSAFEKIGFKNAIYAADPPSKEEDPDWSPEDVRYSVIRYVSTDIQNAMGPHVHDPRTGEILESDIIWYHNVMRLLRNWFFIQTAAINPEARGTNFTEETMGQLIRFVSAHEVGHTLGLPHNMGASHAYPVDSLRSPTFTRKMGTAPSIMDYARFNYVAQPEDGDVGLMPKIGPYDDWSIYYGYKYFPDVSQEKSHSLLQQEILAKADDPLYRFGKQRGIPIDPRSQTEDLGDDAVYASELGIKNLQRTLPNLLSWTQTKGETYEQQKDLYQQVFTQFRRYIGHVTASIGGVKETFTMQGQDEPTYQYIDRAQQLRALQFLEDHVFTAPTWLIAPDISRHFEPKGTLNRIHSIQKNTLSLLFHSDRLARMIEHEAASKQQTFTAQELFESSRELIFRKDMNQIHNRNLQRALIMQWGNMASSTDDTIKSDEISSLAINQLILLQEELRVKGRMSDTESMHIRALQQLLKQYLED